MKETSKEIAGAPSPAAWRERVGVRDCPAPAVTHRRSTDRSRSLRKDQTDAEKKVWESVKDRRLMGYKFRRQFPIGPYFADFACPELKLVVKIDGGQHCEDKKDASRTGFLRKNGYDVIRFWNNEVMENMEGVVQSLTLTLSRHAAGEGTPAAPGNDERY